MIKKNLTRLLLLAFAALFIAAVSNSSGPPASHTGAPGERTCSFSGCHLGAIGVNQGPGSITLRLGSGLTEYEPGQAYQITVELTEPERNSRMGFELTALNASNARAGTLASAGSDVSITTGTVSGGQRQYARHTSQGNRPTSGTTRVWTVNWTAPAAGTGEVTLYVASIGANGNGNADSQDRTYTANLRIAEKTAEEPTLTTNNVGGAFCPGQDIAVSYTATGTFTAGNRFTAQLSNASGSFASPTDIGMVNATASGTIEGTIPEVAPAGTGYRVRVVSSAPAITASDNGADFTVLESVTQPVIERTGNMLTTTQPYASYQWLLAGEPISGANDRSYEPTADGVYSVRVATDESICTATSEPLNFILASRSAKQSATAWTLYPNPAQGQVLVRLNGAASETQAQVFDGAGRLVLMETLKVNGNEAALNVQALPRGLYRVVLRDGGGQTLGSRSLMLR